MKYLKLSLLAMLLMGITTSCFKLEEDDIFDGDAAVRLDNAIAEYTDILTDEGGKWMLQYFANEDEAGYVYLMTFKTDGSVDISGDNIYIGELYGSQNTSMFATENSMWEVIADNGPVLTFNTYNSIFHLFADPEDFASTDTDEQGYGHSGDYEFDIMDYRNDTLFLEGKKYEYSMILTRANDVQDDETFFTELNELLSSTFTSLIPELYMTGSTGRRYVATGASTMIWSFYPEGGDEIVDTQTFNACFTPSGVRFMNPISILSDYGDVEAQAFSIQDGKLVSSDGLTTIESAPLGTLFTDTRFTWQINSSASSGALGDAYTAFADGTKAYNGSTLQYINFYSQYSSGLYTPSMLFRWRMRTGSSTHNCNLYTQIETDGTNVSIHFTGEGDANAITYRTRVEAINAFVETLENGSFRLETDYPLGPKVIRLVDVNDSSSYLTLRLI